MDTRKGNFWDIISLGIPHVGEQIFQEFNTCDLIACLSVSHTWKKIAEKILIKKWKDKITEACDAGHTAIVKLLLDHGYGLTRDEDIIASLHLGCKKGHHGIVNSLLNFFKKNELGDQFLNGLKPDDKDDYDVNPFMVACIYGQKNIVELFLNHSASKCIEWNAKTWDCETAFYFACEKGHSDVVKLLLDHSESKKIDLNTRVHGVKIDFWSTTKERNVPNGLDIAVKLKQISVIKVMIEHPVARKCIGWNFLNSKGETAFHLACQSGNEVIVQMFIDNSKTLNIDLNAKYNGRTGWMDACAHNKPNIVKMLIQYPELIDFNLYHDMWISKPIQNILTTNFSLVPSEQSDYKAYFKGWLTKTSHNKKVFRNIDSR